jgi:LacI family transcriptional regulator
VTPTLVDIARETRTSVSTVSRVLSGGAMANRISKETRQRVQEVADRLGYRPNLLARSLRTRRTYTIALLVSDISNTFFAQLGSLVEQSLSKHGYSLMLCNSGENLDQEGGYLRLMAAKGIDGMIVVPLADNKERITQHVPPTMPLVILDRPITGIESTVSTDQDQSAEILCDALEAVGVERVALVCGPQRVVTHQRRGEVVSKRFEVLSRHNGPAQKATGREAHAQFAHLVPQLQAIVCTNNFLAQGVLEALGDMENPPIIGVFDEIPTMNLLRFPIVCSMQDIPALADACVSQILRLLDDASEGPVRPIVLKARIVTNPAFEAMKGRQGRGDVAVAAGKPAR